MRGNAAPGEPGPLADTALGAAPELAIEVAAEAAEAADEAAPEAADGATRHPRR